MNEVAGPGTITELEVALSEPTEQAVNALAAVDGDVLILGAGGKMGPTLSRMVARTLAQTGGSRRVIAVSRFTDASQRDRLDASGVETLVADLLEPGAVSALPSGSCIRTTR